MKTKAEIKERISDLKAEIVRMKNAIYRFFKNKCIDCKSRSHCIDCGCQRKKGSKQWWMKF